MALAAQMAAAKDELVEDAEDAMGVEAVGAADVVVDVGESKFSLQYCAFCLSFSGGKYTLTLSLSHWICLGVNWNTEKFQMISIVSFNFVL